jgi:predicted nucleic acid-binding protein
VFGRFHLSYNIGVIDALIAQLAVDLDTPLWTFTQKHYAAVPNLRTM